MEQRRFDVIIVGAGIMGSCAAYEAAMRGKSVLLLEQFDFLHHLGSSHGESRTIRAAYVKDYYLPMVLESRRLWEAAQAEAGYRVLTETKHFDMGPADHGGLRAVIRNCAPKSELGARVVGRAEALDAFSGVFQLPEGWTGLVTDVGGVIKATKAVAMFQALAVGRGAVLKDHMEVREIKKREGAISVSTSGGDEFLGTKCVVTVGAWTSKLVNSVCGLELPIQPLHMTISYWRIKEGHEEEFTPGSDGFPTFSSYGEHHIYGTPSMEFPGLIKIVLDEGPPCDPDKRDWACADNSIVGTWITEVLSGRVEHKKPEITQGCMYSTTPDKDYVIDFLGGEFAKDVVVAGGFSGHGFKMGPLVGKILVELAVDGEAAMDLKHFTIHRFKDDLGGKAKGM